MEMYNMWHFVTAEQGHSNKYFNHRNQSCSHQHPRACLINTFAVVVVWDLRRFVWRSRRRRTPLSGGRWGTSLRLPLNQRRITADSESLISVTKWSRWFSFSHCQPKGQQPSPIPRAVFFKLHWSQSKLVRTDLNKKERKEKLSVLTMGNFVVWTLLQYINIQSESHKTFLTWHKVKKLW